MLSVATKAQLAPLEPESGVYFGPWVDQDKGDSAVKLLQRFNYRQLPFFQYNWHIGNTFDSQVIDLFNAQIDETGSKAFLYLTLYPMEGMDRVSDAALNAFTAKMKETVDKGRKVMIRYASEMNGDWFSYGQQPTLFKREWARFVNHVRNGTRDHPGSVAFMWSPNSADSGYPFDPRNEFHNSPTNPRWDPALDTNRDGLFDSRDEGYMPYYPGDDLVDWVGMSIYFYGNTYPYVLNEIPPPNNFVARLTGTIDPVRNLNFYEMFSGSGCPVSRGNKPFFLAETGVPIFVAIKPTDRPWMRPEGRLTHLAQDRVTMRQTWWRQILDPNMLTRFPKLKGISTFEFVKIEDGNSWRDFTFFGTGTNVVSPLGGDDDPALNQPSLDAFRADLRGVYGQSIIWGDNPALDGNNQTAPPASPSTNGNSTGLVGSTPSKSAASLSSSGFFSTLGLIAFTFIFN